MADLVKVVFTTKPIGTPYYPGDAAAFPPDVAKRFVERGSARYLDGAPPEESGEPEAGDDLDGLDSDELLAIAGAEGVELPGNVSRAETIAKYIREARASEG